MTGFARWLCSWNLFTLLFPCCLVSCQTAMKVPVAPWTDSQFIAPDGSPFPYARWFPEQPPRAVVLAIHGLGGAASDWRPLGEYLSTRGIAVYAHELRGMGNDPKKSRVGDLDRPDGWLEDFSSFALRVQATYPDTPIFWYGESLGGIIGTNLITKAPALGLRPCGFILASPIVQVSGKLPRWQERLLWLGAKLTPRLRLNLQSLTSEAQPPAQVVSTTSHLAQLAHTPHAVDRFSLRLLDRIRQLVHQNQDILHHPSAPLLVLYAGHDIFTKPEEVDAFYGKIGGIHKEKRFYPEGYHLLLHDVGSAKILVEIEKWLEKVLKICDF